VYLSLTWDLPSGATIVCTFGFVLIVTGVVRVLMLRRSPVPVQARRTPRAAARGSRVIYNFADEVSELRD
jgi:hypothetical protein